MTHKGNSLAASSEEITSAVADGRQLGLSIGNGAVASAAQVEKAEKPASPQRKSNKPSKTTAKKDSGRKSGRNTEQPKGQRPFPAGSFQDALALGEAIHKVGAGAPRVRRVTLFNEIKRSPDSSSSRALITNSAKYGITKGSHGAENLELTSLGSVATNPDASHKDRLDAQFQLAIASIPAFALLYDTYKGRKLPTHEVMKDTLREQGIAEHHETECVDIFIVNAKFLGLLDSQGGAEVLLPIEKLLMGQSGAPTALTTTRATESSVETQLQSPSEARKPWDNTCFYISPIGEDGGEQRKHADLFLGQIIEPALEKSGLRVVRADHIEQAGMITSQIIEHILYARLVIIDLSFHNPNVFYEMALRHAIKRPVIQVMRKADRIPFDVKEFRTIIIDTSDIYTLVPKLETYRSEIAAQVRAALSDESATTNPIHTFFPGLSVTLPKAT
jgi:hypothetical protein